jgi:parallel beta-helix repeat protein
VTITGIKIREFGNGVYLEDSSNNTISGNIVTQNSAYGIYFFNSSYNSISDNEIAASIGSNIWITNSSQNLINGNIITEGAYGIYFCNSSENNVFGNEIAANSGGGVWLTSSPNNFLFRNNVSEGNYGVVVNSSLNNTVYWNSFVNNTVQAQAEDSANTWDNGYQFGGNYWSDYGGLDVFSGPYQNVTGSDGIGDTPYPINASNSDMYPLINPWAPPDAAATNITTVKLIVGRGYTLRINYTAANLGNKAEGFNISLYSDSIVIASNSTILIMGNSIKSSIRWNTTDFSYGNYTLSEFVEPLPSEVELSNNNFTGDTVLVTIPGDITGDFKVNYLDLGRVIGVAYGKTPTSPYWDPVSDINDDNKIQYLDLGILLAHYGQHYP